MKESQIDPSFFITKIFSFLYPFIIPIGKFRSEKTAAKAGKYYLSKMSAHAIGVTQHDVHVCNKVFWAVVFLLFLGATGYLVYMRVSEFLLFNIRQTTTSTPRYVFLVLLKSPLFILYIVKCSGVMGKYLMPAKLLIQRHDASEGIWTFIHLYSVWL